MKKEYIIKKNSVLDLIEEIETFSERMDNFNEKYNHNFIYGIDVYPEKDKNTSKGEVYVALVKLENDE